MAAHYEPEWGRSADFSIVDLRRLSAWELDPLLLAETVEWERRLDWDYSKSADLVREFASTGSLAGAAIMDGGAVAGYGYTAMEDHKGLIGNLYVRPDLRGTRTEAALFHALLQDLINAPQVRRIESQLMLVDRPTALTVAHEAGLRLYERTLMSCGVDGLRQSMSAAGSGEFRLEPWGEQWNEAAAMVIFHAYRDHVDSNINDQYRAFGSASHFLKNLVEFQGCGTFFSPAGLMAFDKSTGRPAGLALCSFVAPAVGHVTQLCVTPNAREKGLGYALLRAAAFRLADAGAVRIGLTVTLANLPALNLYQRCGFREVRRFFAYAREV